MATEAGHSQVADCDSELLHADNDVATRNHRDGLVVQDDQGRIVSFNASALRVLGMTAEQLTGKTSVDPSWAAVTEDGKPFEGEEHPAMVALRSGKAVVNVLLGVHSPDGLRWLRIDSYPYDSADGRRVVTWFADVTQERAAVAELRNSITTLQHAMLPNWPTVLRGVDFSFDYRAAMGELLVGGDFLDIFEISPTTFGFFIGDVCGHDIDAMSVTALARHTLRAGMLHGMSPPQAFRWLHDAILATRAPRFCTALCGVGTVVTGGPHAGIRISLANAGHPPAVVSTFEGERNTVRVAGPLLGVSGVEPTQETVSVHLRPGDQLVLFTDGLLDSTKPRRDHDQFVAQIRRSDTAEGTMRLITEMVDRTRTDSLTGRDDTAHLVIGAGTDLR